FFHKGIINVHFVGGVPPHNGQVSLFHLAVHKLLMHGFFYILVESKEQDSACFSVKPMYGTDMLAYLHFHKLKRKLLGISGDGPTMNQYAVPFINSDQIVILVDSFKHVTFFTKIAILAVF